jgi:hypothetical protein
MRTSSPVDIATGKTLLLRADGSREMGRGHLMRCLALAQRIAAR